MPQMAFSMAVRLTCLRNAPSCRFLTTIAADKLDTARKQLKGEEWDAAWSKGVTPWDLGGPTPVLTEVVHNGDVPDGSSILVPGCGSGYDLVTLTNGVKNATVVGLDLSAISVDLATKRVIQPAGLQVGVPAQSGSTLELITGDFFSFETEHAPFDFIFDYTFFCALPLHMRPAWGERMARLLSKSGSLLTLIFPIDEAQVGNPDVGPPFPVSLDEYRRVLSPHGIELHSHFESPLTVKPRKGRELAAWWKKTS